ncbi:MAG TPA: hypothetical protein VKH63_22890 [Candidatus Acidoferrum sp.]|jgi:hypothetical protein|nr:hypothetical protein [Candidatus Acidoferrum sp.]
MWLGCDGEMQFRGALALEKVVRAGSAFGRAPLNAHARRVVGRRVVAIFLAGAIRKLPITCKNSGWPGIFGLRDGSVRKKFIGHGMRGRSARFAIETQIRLARGAFTLLQKQTREGCVGVVVHSLIKQSRDLLADIGGVRKTRQKIFPGGHVDRCARYRIMIVALAMRVRL